MSLIRTVILSLLVYVVTGANSSWFTSYEQSIIRSVNATIIGTSPYLYNVIKIRDGKFPMGITLLNRSRSISIVYNYFVNDSLPTELCNLRELTYLYITTSSFSGTIPECLFSLPNLRTLRIVSTAISGTIPSLVDSSLTYIQIESSRISGTVPEVSSTLQTLKLDVNRLSGTLSDSIYKVRQVSLSHNSITGMLPDPLVNSAIISLNLAYNYLCGNISRVGNIMSFDLSYNQYTYVEQSRTIDEYYMGKMILDLSGNRIPTKMRGTFLINVEDVDECAIGTHSCPDKALCTDGWYPRMSYTCTCNDGYRISGVQEVRQHIMSQVKCVDINECLTDQNACSPGTCLNLQGSYICCSNNTYSNDTHCLECYGDRYTYKVSSSTHDLPSTASLNRCFGSCNNGLSFKYKTSLSPYCVIDDILEESCMYPCHFDTMGMTTFEVISKLYIELNRGNYISELTGIANCTTLDIEAMSITLTIRCIDCFSVCSAIDSLIPGRRKASPNRGLHIERIKGGVVLTAKGISKRLVSIIVTVIVLVCMAILVVVAFLTISRDRTSQLHEPLAKTIRVPLMNRLTKPLFISTDYVPQGIQGIKRVLRVHNTVLLDNFVGAYVVQKNRMDKELFHKRHWTTKEDKLAVYDKFSLLVDSQEWNDPQYPTVVAMYHGTSYAVGVEICKTGFATLSLLDSGWYGSGIYFTSFYKYCIPYICSRKDPVILISYILPGNVYPVTETTLAGKPLMSGYQSHYVKTNIAGKIDKDGEYDELVVSQECQILPMYLVELEPFTS